MSDLQHKSDFDLDEDLFDFGAVMQSSRSAEPEEDLEEIFASFREGPPAEDLLAIPSAPSTAPVGASRAPVASPTAHGPEATPSLAENTARPTAAAPFRPAREPAHERDAEVATAPRGVRFSKGMVAIALSVTLLNSVLAVVMLRGSSAGHDVRAIDHGKTPAPVEGKDAEKSTGSLTAALPDPESTGEVYDHPTLEAAREEIARGEYAAARQHLYGLLSIIDRLDDPRRESVEAECQFLVAQALHLEALERMGGQR